MKMSPSTFGAAVEIDPNDPNAAEIVAQYAAETTRYAQEAFAQAARSGGPVYLAFLVQASGGEVVPGNRIVNLTTGEETGIEIQIPEEVA